MIRARSPRLSEEEKLLSFFREKAELPKSEFSEFIKFVSVQEFAKGDFFTKIGDERQMLGFVFTGGFLSYYVSKDGNIFIRNFCIEGTTLGSYATILIGTKAHVMVEAFEDSTAAVVEYKNFKSFFDRHPAWERIARKMAEDNYISRAKREYQFLVLDAEKRYLEFMKDFPELDKRVTQAIVAAYIGITPVSLSRIKNKKSSSLRSI